MLILSYLINILSSTFSHVILIRDREFQEFIGQIEDSYTLSTRIKMVSGLDATCTIDFIGKNSQKKRLLTKRIELEKEFLKEFTEPGIYKIVIFSFNKNPGLVEVSVISDKVEDLTKQNRELKQSINRVFNELDKSYWSGLKTLRLKSQIHKTVEIWKFRAYFLFLLTPLYLGIAYSRHFYLKSFFTIKSESI